MKNFNNKSVWITGASSGIGKALAEQFAKEGANLILTARSLDKLSAIKAQLASDKVSVAILEADLTDLSQLNALAQKAFDLYGSLDLLINNAGISQRSLGHETPLAIDQKIMNLNYFSTIALTKAVLPYMIKQQSGQIAVISSISGLFGFPMRTAYAASKHALQGFFESLRPEISKFNIGVNIISPGRIKTDISLNAITKDGTAHGEMDPGQLNGMPVEQCAQKIIKGLKKDKKDILIGRKELLLVYIHRFLPFLYHRIVYKISAK